MSQSVREDIQSEKKVAVKVGKKAAAKFKARVGQLAVSAAVLGIPMAASASTYDEARVLSAEPVYETISREVPVQACRQQDVAYRSGRNRSATGPILGAIIGGALGNAVGSEKRNKQVGAVVGAVLGGSIGADISRRQRSGPVEYRTEEVCDTRYEVRSEEHLAGYDVRYEYAGTTYQTRMPRDPGDTLRVRVRVSPAE